MKPPHTARPAFPLASAIAALLAAPVAHAANLTWDLTSGDGAVITAGSGSWNTTGTNLVWNNAGANPNLAWTQTSGTVGTQAAIFGGTDGTVDQWTVTLGAAMAATTTTFNNTGYKITGSTLTTGAITVASGKTATINSILALSGTHNIKGTLNLTGGCSGGTNILWNDVGTLNLSAGTYAMSNTRFDLPAWNQTGGTVNLSSSGTSGSWIGYQNTVRNVNVTVSGGSFNVNGTSGAYLGIGRAWSGANATLTVKTGGTVNLGNTAEGSLVINQDGTANTAKLDVQGGTFTVGTAAAASAVNFFPNGAGASKNAMMTQSGGTATINGIAFGVATGTYDPASLATLQLSGGSLYVGVNGITRGSGASALPVTIQLQGGTLGASDNWSSSLNMKLGTTGGGPTIQAATAASVAKNITLSGILSNDGAVTGTLTKAGAGLLTLSGPNTYTGLTTSSAGKLSFSTAGSATTPVTVAANATVGVLVAATDGQWINTGDLTSQAGSILNVDYNSTAPSTGTAPIQVANFVPGSGVAIRLSGSGGLTTGQAYPLVAWTGSGPTDATAFTLVGAPGSLSVVGNTLVVTIGAVSPQPLNWNTGNAPWDTTTSGIWVDSAASPTTYMDGVDQVVFGDASDASGNPVVTLSSTLAPVAVTMKCASHDYTISGTGEIAGSTSLVLHATNTRTLTLATANSYTGGTTVNAGTLALGSATALGTGTFTLGGGNLDSSVANLVNTSNNAQSWNADFTFVGSQNLNLGTGTVTPSANRQVTVTANTLTVGGVIGGGAISLTKAGAGTLTLTNKNTYAGGTVVTGGTLQVNGSAFSNPAQILPANKDLTISGATVSLLGQWNSIFNSTAGTLTLNAGGTLLDDKTGIAHNLFAVVLNGGTTTLSAGTLIANSSAALGSGASTNTLIFNGGSLQAAGPISSPATRGVTCNAATATIDTNGNDVSLAGNIGGTGSLTKIGLGTLTLSGTNTYTGNTVVNAGTLVLAAGAQLKFVLGAASGVNNNLSGAGTATLDGSFVIDTSAADALASGSWTLENVTSLTGAYGGSFSVVGFTDAGSDKWTKVNGTKTYTFDETTGILTLAPVDPYATWALSKGLDGTAGHEAGKGDDPDHDGHNNLYEFAFDGNPLAGGDDGKIVAKIATLGADQVLTLTLPLRSGASFSASSGDQISALIDGIYYRVEGDVTLSSFADSITEVTGSDAATLQTGLPALSTGWTYRSFRAPGTVATAPKAFLRASISDTP